MLKKLLLVAALAFPMMASAQTLKVGIVDVDEIVQKLPDYAEAQTKLSDTSKKYEDEYAKLNEEMKRRYDELEKMGDDELPAIRERKVKDFQEYQLKIQQFEQSATQELSRYQQDLMAPIYTKVNNAIQSVGQEGGYSLIEAKISQIVLYYADPVVDITNEVKAKLGVN
ncbi:MAG: OmpH family outer membrane protein [Muribaculaceae bacterium]|nr:OmpH family outer membrane protein [Muribaculaceae bacterium]